MQDKENSLDIYGPFTAGAVGTGVMGNYLCWQVPSLAGTIVGSKPQLSIRLCCSGKATCLPF